MKKVKDLYAYKSLFIKVDICLQGVLENINEVYLMATVNLIRKQVLLLMVYLKCQN